MGSLKQVEAAVVEIRSCISQKNPLTSLRTSCLTMRRGGGGREEAEQGKVQQHHLLVHRELHLNTLPEQVNTHLALRLNVQGSKQRGFDHKAAYSIMYPWVASARYYAD